MIKVMDAAGTPYYHHDIIVGFFLLASHLHNISFHGAITKYQYQQAKKIL